MEIINKTVFNFAPLVGRYNFPLYSLTFIVKGTFDLKSGKPVVISEEQFFPTADEFYPEDKDKIGGPTYPSDFAFFKPRADLLLVGKFHSPQNKKVYSANVKFQVGSKSKTLNLTGNRYWVGGFPTNTATIAEPFSEMELRYENSFGGADYKKNPVGKGIDKVDLKTGDKLVPIPNILHFGEKILPGVKLEPAGFGPISETWVQRLSKLGSYKGNYLKERWPWFAKDFDWGYFNTAPADMQLNGYLKGDEKLYFENLHPAHSEYHSQLPGIRLRCFLNERKENPKRIESKLFKEVKMNLDTLWIDIENEKLVLVWRAISDINSEDYQEVEHCFIISEQLHEQPSSVEFYKEKMNKELYEPIEEFNIPEWYETNDKEDDGTEAELVAAEEKMRDSLIQSGIDPDNPPSKNEEQKKKEGDILKQLGLEEESEEVILNRELFIERIKKNESFVEEDLRGIDLSNLDLKGLNFQNAIISGVSLKNSDLSNCNLSGTNLSGSDLSGSRLNKAILKDSDLTRANLADADFTGAVLEGSIFENANLRKAILNNVKGKGSHFTNADLTECSLIKGELSGADFSKSILINALFQESILAEASFENSTCTQINLSSSNLTKVKAAGGDFTRGKFIKSFGSNITWVKSNLSGADFSYSEMEEADFTSAVAQKANLYAANMKFARFTKADLKKASLKEMNLFQGSLEKADLTGADCSKSNFYGVEFLDSIIKETSFIYSNLKMTKLSRS